ncbi:MAG: HD domain-containing protein [Burkholderiales bacterium]|nr:HD domain-containing protein [Burkholderiales bacterium]
MTKKKIREHDLTVGEAVPWDVFSEEGELLVRKGHVVSSVKQLDILIKRGLYAASHAHPPKSETYIQPSVVRMLNSANKRLEFLSREIIAGKGGEKEKLLEVAHLVYAAVDLQPNVALACILHNQKVGMYAIRHCIDTAIVARMIAKAMKKSAAEKLVIIAAALTMNLGMLAHQERLQSHKDALSPEDAEIIKRHPIHTVDMLRHAGVDDEVWLACVLLHHENEDGSGYPFGKRGHDVPLDAKIISLADRYTARVSSRNYRKSLVPNAALRDMLLEGNSSVDQSLVATFIKELGTYPIGTFVRLENGEIGVVTSRGASSTTPIVDSLIGPRGAPLERVNRRDTSKPLCGVREVLSEHQAAVGFNLDQLWGPVASA